MNDGESKAASEREPRKARENGGTTERARERSHERAAPAADPVQEADEESFPASDPPAWSPGHPGAPKH